MFLPNEKGQGLVEYAIVLVVVALMVVCFVGVIALVCSGLPAIAAALIIFWEPISAWGTALVAGLMVGNPTSIFTAAVVVTLVVIVILWLTRRRS